MQDQAGVKICSRSQQVRDGSFEQGPLTAHRNMPQIAHIPNVFGLETAVPKQAGVVGHLDGVRHKPPDLFGLEAMHMRGIAIGPMPPIAPGSH